MSTHTVNTIHADGKNLEHGAEGEKPPTQVTGSSKDTSLPAEVGKRVSLAHLSNGRKTILLFAFAIAQFVDVCNVSGAAIAARDIAQDTGLTTSQVVWVSGVFC
jgi:hypothetical protein